MSRNARRRPPTVGTASLFDHLWAAATGAAAGAVCNAGFVLFWSGSRRHLPDLWTFNGSLGWFLLAGALLGLLGGAAFARAVWEWAVEDFVRDSVWGVGFWLALVLVLVFVAGCVLYGLA